MLLHRIACVLNFTRFGDASVILVFERNETKENEEMRRGGDIVNNRSFSYSYWKYGCDYCKISGI